MRHLLLISIVLVLSGVAATADPPPYIKKFQVDASSCRPSCYDREPSVPWGDNAIKRVCGYKEWNFQQTQIRGRWSKLESRGIPAVEPTITSCKLPKDGGGIAKQARAAFEPFKDDLKNLAFVPLGGWKTERDANLNPVRWQNVRIHASNWGQKPNECGTHGAQTVCEASGSRAAKAINFVHYRLDEAKKWEAKEPEACQISSFFAAATARGLVKFRDHRVSKNQWTSGLTYKTRYDGEIDEKTLLSKVQDYEKEAVALHKKCGGASPLVTEMKSDRSSTEPEFEIVPNPDEE